MKRPNLKRPVVGRRGAIVVAVVAALALGTGLALPRGHDVDPTAKPVDIGILVSRTELNALPRSGSAWRRLRKVADGNIGRANVANQNSTHDVKTLAVALVFARTRNERYRQKAVAALMSAIGTERGARALAVGRNVAAYVIAADLVNLREYDPARNKTFSSWLDRLRTQPFQGRSLVSTQNDRPNNWGTMAGASRVAIDVYLGDQADLDRAATVFRGWLGDRTAYAGFVFGSDDSSWQADPSKPVAVNPAGAVRNGISIDGALPAEMRRGGKFRIPPRRTSYPWGALSGALVEAQILQRQGFDTWAWQDQALRRAVDFLARLDHQFGGWWARGDDTWEPWLVNRAYGTHYPVSAAVLPGKNMGWTDWLYSGEAPRTGPPPPPTSS